MADPIQIGIAVWQWATKDGKKVVDTAKSVGELAAAILDGLLWIAEHPKQASFLTGCAATIVGFSMWTGGAIGRRIGEHIADEAIKIIKGEEQKPTSKKRKKKR